MIQNVVAVPFIAQTTLFGNKKRVTNIWKIRNTGYYPTAKSYMQYWQSKKELKK